MSVKRVSGGGGQGRRPGRDIKGVNYFGAGYAPPSPREMKQAQEAIKQIGDALSRASSLKRNLNYPKIHEEVGRLSTVLHDPNVMTEFRAQAVSDLDRLRSTLIAKLPEQITREEREQLGLGRSHAAELAFLAAVQSAITEMVRKGIKKPPAQATLLNALGLRPFQGVWTPRLVVMFFQRQDERRKVQATRTRFEERSAGQRSGDQGQKSTLCRYGSLASSR